uniref:Uncharacterized protein n=1 Tax=Anguilla anguilla TaxID=7936 RepID=A0A0E9SWR1_ANGAN
MVPWLRFTFSDSTFASTLQMPPYAVIR